MSNRKILPCRKFWWIAVPLVILAAGALVYVAFPGFQPSKPGTLPPSYVYVEERRPHSSPSVPLPPLPYNGFSQLRIPGQYISETVAYDGKVGHSAEYKNAGYSDPPIPREGMAYMRPPAPGVRRIVHVEHTNNQVRTTIIEIDSSDVRAKYTRIVDDSAPPHGVLAIALQKLRDRRTEALIAAGTRGPVEEGTGPILGSPLGLNAGAPLRYVRKVDVR